MNKEKLLEILRDYFNIGDSYTYELTRVKSAFPIGTIDLEDFQEWDEEKIENLAEYIIRNG